MQFYILFMLVSLNINSWWWVWLMLEVLNWTFIYFLKNMNLLIVFFMWQSISSIIFLYSFLFFKKKLLIFISLLMKTSLPPFHLWMWMLLSVMDWKSMVLLMCVHKYTPILIMMNNFSYLNCFYFIIFSLISFFNMWMASSLKKIFWVILLNDTVWLMLSFYCMLNMMFIYMMFNFIIMFIFMNWKLKFSGYLMMLLFVTSLPPLPTFQLKWLILSSLSINMMVVLIVNLLMLLFFMILLFMTLKMHKMFKDSLLSLYYMSFSMGFWFFFM
uniref:NADH dehydrogenase subunit 2 n=1 Tax=Diximermis spiculatus TaxID=3313489 RepID=Q1HBB3_9BILA|nr:NADH dehydrogenase subunit 2 [Strelkovimermis spiculatus]ABF48167.1 NADH dehydrogenase subunit 2 [Strelkovimermis spiculatus]ABF48179.1 NADH dehydrogenase subunit 2 [Strelkovimermis spiculatus]